MTVHASVLLAVYSLSISRMERRTIPRHARCNLNSHTTAPLPSAFSSPSPHRSGVLQLVGLVMARLALSQHRLESRMASGRQTGRGQRAGTWLRRWNRPRGPGEAHKRPLALASRKLTDDWDGAAHTIPSLEKYTVLTALSTHYCPGVWALDAYPRPGLA